MHFDTVVVGGGAGGLELAARLGRRLGPREGRERVLLVDRSTFHIWKPTLHEVAAGTLNSNEDELSYLAQAHWNHFKFRIGSLQAMEVMREQLERRAERAVERDPNSAPALYVRGNLHLGNQALSASLRSRGDLVVSGADARFVQTSGQTVVGNAGVVFTGILALTIPASAGIA